MEQSHAAMMRNYKSNFIYLTESEMTALNLMDTEIIALNLMDIGMIART